MVCGRGVYSPPSLAPTAVNIRCSATGGLSFHCSVLKVHPKGPRSWQGPTVPGARGHAIAGPNAEPAEDNRYILAQARLLRVTGNSAGALDRLKQVALPRNAPRLPLLLDDMQAKVEMTQAYLQQGLTTEALAYGQAALERRATVDGSRVLPDSGSRRLAVVR